MEAAVFHPIAELDDLLALSARAVAAEAGSYAPADVDVDAARLARQIRHSARMTIGLLPAHESVPVQPLACELARALSRLTQSLIVILDPEQKSGSPEPHISTLFAAQLLESRVATLVPRLRAPAGARFEMVKLMNRLLNADREALGQALVDLSGCQLAGELLGAAAMLSGVIVVGQAGRTRERQIHERVAIVPPDMCLGVVLTGL